MAPGDPLGRQAGKKVGSRELRMLTGTPVSEGIWGPTVVCVGWFFSSQSCSWKKGKCPPRVFVMRKLAEVTETAPTTLDTVRKASHCVRHSQRAPARPSSGSDRESSLPSPTLITHISPKGSVTSKRAEERREAPEMPGISTAPEGVKWLPQTPHDS